VGQRLLGQRLLGRGELEQLLRSQLSTAARIYLAAVSLAAVGAAIALWRSNPNTAQLPAFLIVAALGALAHAYPIQGFRHQAYQVTLPFIILAAAMFSAVELIAFIAVIHIAEQIRVRRRLYIQWFNACDYLASAAVAGLIYYHAAVLLPASPLGRLTAALAAACTFILLNRVLLAAALWLGRRLSPLASGLFQPELLAADLVIAWVAGPMLVLALDAGAWTVLVTAGPLLLARPALAALLGRHAEKRPRAEAHLQAPAA
jgi:hypothetical protein